MWIKPSLCTMLSCFDKFGLVWKCVYVITLPVFKWHDCVHVSQAFIDEMWLLTCGYCAAVTTPCCSRPFIIVVCMWVWLRYIMRYTRSCFHRTYFLASFSCGSISTDKGGCTVTKTLGNLKSVDRVCQAITSNTPYSLQPSPVSFPLLLLYMADAMLLV